MVPSFPQPLAGALLLNKPMYDARAFVSAVPVVTTAVFPQWWAEWRSTAEWVFKPLLVRVGKGR
jgi:hypothetical protein